MCSRFRTIARGRIHTPAGYAVGRFGSRITRSLNGTPSSRCIWALVASNAHAPPSGSTKSHRRAKAYSFSSDASRVYTIAFGPERQVVPVPAAGGGGEMPAEKGVGWRGVEPGVAISPGGDAGTTPSTSRAEETRDHDDPEGGGVVVGVVVGTGEPTRETARRGVGESSLRCCSPRRLARRSAAEGVEGRDMRARRGRSGARRSSSRGGGGPGAKTRERRESGSRPRAVGRSRGARGCEREVLVVSSVARGGDVRARVGGGAERGARRGGQFFWETPRGTW